MTKTRQKRSDVPGRSVSSPERLKRLADPPITPERSAQMALVKAQDTKPEIRVRKAAYAMGLRYRLHCRSLPGTPDLVFTGRKAVLFVHGCFWHRHKGCAATRTPKTRIAFWKAKFSENVKRDKKVRAQLTKLGWDVFVLWECETTKPGRINEVLQRVACKPNGSGRERSTVARTE